MKAHVSILSAVVLALVLLLPGTGYATDWGGPWLLNTNATSDSGEDYAPQIIAHTETQLFPISPLSTLIQRGLWSSLSGCMIGIILDMSCSRTVPNLETLWNKPHSTNPLAWIP